MKKLSIALLLTFAGAFLSLHLNAQQGPNKEGSDTVAKPRKKDGQPAEADLPKIPSKFGKKEDRLPEGPSFKSDVTAVTVDVAVLDKNGRFIPNIPRGNFRILEDNVPQTVSNFSIGEAPMTVCMVIEFSNRYQSYYTESWYQTLMAAYGFVETLKPEDFVAIVAYDLRPETLSDFTTNRMQTQEALQRLRIAAFSESNLFDALTDTADRMSEIEGRKAIVLISSGVDTFSKLTFDKTRKIIQTAGVPIYSLGLMQALREYYDARGAMGPSLVTSDLVLTDEHGQQLSAFLKKGRPEKGMPAFATLSHQQMIDITEFLHLQVENVANRGSYKMLNILVGNAAKGKVYVDRHCMSCHTVETFAHIASKFRSPEQLQRNWIWPARYGTLTAKVKTPEGTFSGWLKQISDFRITLVDRSGKTHTIDRGPGVDVQMSDRLAGHQEIIMTLSNDDMHDVTSYLETLK